MKKLFNIAIIAIVLSFTACKKENQPERISSESIAKTFEPGIGDWGTNPATEIMPPIIPTTLPSFSLESLYVVTKEYESAEDGTSRKNMYNGRQITSYSKSEYVECRLMDLYPNIAYTDLLQDSQDFYDSVMIIYNSTQYSDLSDTLSSKVTFEDKDEFIPYVSDENEFEIFNMDEKEIYKFKRLIELARMKEFASLEDINTCGPKHLNEAKFDWITFSMLAVAVSAYVYQRAMLCAERANNKATNYYPNQTDAGKIGDAYRHILVNVLLRQSLTQPIAYFIMDVYYENINPNAPCDRYMDWHNNYVGRRTKYSDFKNTNNWETWATNVKNYVDNSSNRVKMNWNTSTSQTVVRNQEKTADDRKYIIWNDSTN